MSELDKNHAQELSGADLEAVSGGTTIKDGTSNTFLVGEVLNSRPGSGILKSADSGSLNGELPEKQLDQISGGFDPTFQGGIFVGTHASSDDRTPTWDKVQETRTGKATPGGDILKKGS